MEQVNISKFPIKIQLDSAHEKMQDVESRFLKNISISVNSNPNNTNLSGNNIATGGNSFNITPTLSNEITDEEFSLPAGINKTVGSFECKELNELYWFVWNENNEHTINVIDGLTEKCKTVGKGACFNFSLDPQHAIPEHKVWLQVTYDSKLEGDENIKYVKEKELVWTDSLNNVGQLNVLASIGSNFFTTDYFKPVYPHYETCSYVTLAPIAPNFCPQVELIKREIGDDGHAVDKELPNKLYNTPIQIAYNFNYIDNRPSSVSSYSEPIIVGGTLCSELNPETLPRCAKLNFWVGNAFVNQINIYFRLASVVNENGITVAGAWKLYDTINKHNCPDDDGNWWERTEAWEDYNYDPNFNTIEYIFCNNKECVPIDQKLFEHIENNIPFACVALAPAGNSLILSNCLVGSDNLTCEEKKSFDITLTPQESDVCTIPKRTIKMYAIIRNDSTDESGNGNECQFLFGDVKGGKEEPIDGRFYFGGFGWRKNPTTTGKRVAIDGRRKWDSWKDYKQYVPSDIDEEVGGLVGYFEGTNYAVVSKQVKYFNGDCDVEELGIIYRELSSMYNTNGSFDSIVKDLKDGEYLILQEWTFEDVLAGKYVFRVAGHRTGMSVGFENTSTYVRGYESTTPCMEDSGTPVTPAIKDTYEWIIDVCDNDYNSLEDGYLMVIKDLTLPDFDQDVNLINKYWYNLVSELYLYEDSNNTFPFEKQQLTFTNGSFKDRVLGIVHQLSDGYLVQNPLNIPLLVPASGIVVTTESITDHNGFVFYREQFYRRKRLGSLAGGIIYEFTVPFTEPTLGHITITYTDKCTLKTLDDIVVGITQVKPNVTLLSNFGYRGLKGTVSKSTGTLDQDCNRTQIIGTLLDADNNALAGITVGYSGSKFVRTDGFGKFKVFAHQNTSFNRCDYFIISNSGSSCTIACIDSEECNLCCADTFNQICLPSCVNCEDIIVDKGDLFFKKINFSDKGLKGRYGIGVVGWDYFGRVVTGGVNIIKYVDTSECWNKHPILEWFWNGNVLLPDEVKYISFFITKNLNGTMLQWVADSFDLLDKNGNITSNRGSAVAVAVNMKSLLQYNVINKFNVLVNYGFVDGDILRIIDDCENPIVYRITGTTFGNPSDTALETELSLNTNDATTTSKTNFATDNGSTVIIPFDSQIEAYLEQCAVKIEIVRPYACTPDQFFELCGIMPVINGIPLAGNGGSGSGSGSDSGNAGLIGGVLNAFDTYKIFRNIPKISDCSQNPSDDPYFSNNVTDFWGAGVGSFGRVGAENPYAQRIWREGYVISSLARINNGIVNGLATFWSENAVDYDLQNFGGIQAMFAFRNLIGFICTQDYFMAGYKVPYLTYEQGQVIVNSFSLGQPQQKKGMNYGCVQIDTSSISFNDGYATYLSNSNYIKTDFIEAWDISKYGMSSYMLAKTKHIQNFNQSLINQPLFDYYCFEAISGYDYMTDSTVVTLRPRNGLSQNTKSFVNENRDWRIEVGETIVFNHNLKSQDAPYGAWSNARGYVPEYYGKLDNASSGKQLYAFAKGIPYSQNNQQGSFCTFFGHKQTPVIEVVVNNTDSKVKIYEAVTQEILPQSLFIDRIMTEEQNSLSCVPMAIWARKENIFYAGLFRDMASYWDENYMQESTYYEGKRIFGKFAFIRYVNTFDNSDKYFALNHFWTSVSGSELSMKPQIPNQG